MGANPILSAPIFISYSSKDQDIAETICKALGPAAQKLAGFPAATFAPAIIFRKRSSGRFALRK